VPLRGNVHPLVHRESDHGSLSDAQSLKRLVIVLRRNSEQEAAMSKFLTEQQNRSSDGYHVWLTPEEFGQRFGARE